MLLFVQPVNKLYINIILDEILYYENYNDTDVVTPVNANRLEALLRETAYDSEKTQWVLDGFRNGFDLGYRRPSNLQRRAPNLKLRVGSELELWNKVMKEVKLDRFAGPYKEIPFKNFIQSPIGLVPKDGSKSTRLIFHLSYPCDGLSVNSETPDEYCLVKYPNFSEAIGRCLEEIKILEASGIFGGPIFIGKLDMTSAFRNLGIRPDQYFLLVMKAKSPLDHKWYYFFDKNLPFGASSSCKIFQEVSNCIAHIFKVRAQRPSVNYLDNYLFCHFIKSLCDAQIQLFLDICQDICFPVSMEKTFWGSTRLVFLVLMINTICRVICIPLEKIQKAKLQINNLLQKPKATVHQIQKLAGLLNFLCKAIIPGRAFTRRLYSLTTTAKGVTLKQHHHMRVTNEIKHDLNLWVEFLDHPSAVCQPFMDFSETYLPEQMLFYMDSSRNTRLGCGSWCGAAWYSQMWNQGFILEKQPSIEYLELFAVTAGILLWVKNFAN